VAAVDREITTAEAEAEVQDYFVQMVQDKYDEEEQTSRRTTLWTCTT